MLEYYRKRLNITQPLLIFLMHVLRLLVQYMYEKGRINIQAFTVLIF